MTCNKTLREIPGELSILATKCPLRLEMLEQMENEPFSEFDVKSLKSWNFMFRPNNI